ncbi:MAG: acyltransferase 3 [Candidatus Eremiobacteraeota bacterium]|nr:acyltransferase 3 [Candidatus Eremiobacteraeota bacterium]
MTTVVPAAAVAPRELAVASEAGRVPELDGVRAIAIWLVLIIHIALHGRAAQDAGASLQGVPHLAYLAVSHMWLGVDLFFVLSGFLITGILLDAKRRPAYYRTFFVRRALRIVPLVAVVLVVMSVLEPGYTAWYALGALFLADVVPYAHVATPPGAPPLWSLAVEEQFYLLWPAIVMLLRPSRLALLAVAIVVAEPVFRALAPAGSLLEVPWFRSDGLAFGALAALWVRSPFAATRTKALLGAIGAVVAALFALDLTAGGGSLSEAIRLTEADLVFVAAVLAAVTWSGAPAFGFLRTSFARFTAETSFCVYLIHVPLIGWVEAHGLSAAATPFAAAGLRFLWVIPAAFGLAALSRHVIELPALRLKRVLAA